ncbi:hypothetical protein PG997_003263 [Apiospora hydei]|uniref:Uncharacterized protein n=1 Tax=Apiospora hydei TaxID=1337664 RepID=A0ABR1WYT2_9PEZI
MIFVFVFVFLMFLLYKPVAPSLLDPDPLAVETLIHCSTPNPGEQAAVGPSVSSRLGAGLCGCVVLGLQADVLGPGAEATYPVTDVPPDALLLGPGQLEEVVEAADQLSGDAGWEYGDDVLLDGDDGGGDAGCSRPAGEETVEDVVEPLVPEEVGAAARRAAGQLLLLVVVASLLLGDFSHGGLHGVRHGV